MATRRPKKKKLTFNPDQEPQFERGDLVQMMGITGPTMLVTKVSDGPKAVETDDDDEEEEEDENGGSKNGITASVGADGFLEGEFMVTVIWFNTSNEMQGEYDGHEFPEGLLQLVKPSTKVREEAEAVTREVRGAY